MNEPRSSQPYASNATAPNISAFVRVDNLAFQVSSFDATLQALNEGMAAGSAIFWIDNRLVPTPRHNPGRHNPAPPEPAEAAHQSSMPPAVAIATHASQALSTPALAVVVCNGS